MRRIRLNVVFVMIALMLLGVTGLTIAIVTLQPTVADGGPGDYAQPTRHFGCRTRPG